MLSHTLKRIKSFHSLTFRPLSYYPVDDITSGLNEEEIGLRKTMFDLVQKKLTPKAYQIDKENNFKDMREFWRQLGHIGALGITADINYGGTGGGYLDLAIITEEIARASASVALSYGAHSSMCVDLINRFGTKEQKHKYLPKLCNGEHIGALAMSESDAGSDIFSMKLRADKDEDYYVLNGKKFWITNGPDADVFVVYAKTNSKSEKPQNGISVFVVEKAFEGLSAGTKLEKLGMRGSHTSELVFENCRIPKENLLGEENKGVRLLMSGIQFERLCLASIPLGIMQACCDVAFKYAHERKQFNTKIAEFQMIQSKLADMHMATVACRSYLYNTARACDRSHINSKDCSGVIVYLSESARKMALDAIQILGGNGYINDYPTGRLLRDANLCVIGNEVRRLIIARNLNKEYS